MPLTSGTRLGPYEIEAAAGAGGMGEVYRARDTRLDRAVAIKVLPARFSQNTELRQRLEREARAVAKLSHANICALYDVGHQEGMDFLVLEYLEGETLEQRLQKGPLPPAQLLGYATEIADALEKAHRQGIIHRDLKPGNIMLTKAGAKLMDFGLAKTVEQAPVAAVLTEMTATDRKLTAEGTILGTFQYMAPEQLEGAEADARTDIFALGMVIYEMATGRPAFGGKTKASLIASILSAEPAPLSALAPMTPPALDRVVKTCLAKSPDDRFQTAHDLKLQLEWIAEGGSQAGVPAPVAAHRRHREWMAWTSTALLVVLAAILGALYYRSATAPVRVVRSSILPPPKTVYDFQGAAGAGPVAISPDGTKIAFVATGEDHRSMIWVRALDENEGRPLPSTDSGSFPFWSPDSRFLGFFAGGKLRTIEASGGPPLVVCDAPDGRGGAWSPAGVIVFGGRYTSLFKVAATGGQPVPATKLEEAQQERSHRFPVFLPDGRHFLYLVTPTGGETEQNAVYLGSIDSLERKLIVHTAYPAAYANGYLLYLRERTLIAQPFDLRRNEVTGDGVPLAEHVQVDTIFALSMLSVSQNGILIYQSGAGSNNSQLAWFDRSGKQVSTLGEPAVHFTLSISPDAKKVAAEFFDVQSSNSDIWVLDTARGLKTRFTFDPARDYYPVWSPDGSQIVFASARGKAQADLYLKSSSGVGSDQLLLQSDQEKLPTDWSRDGKYLAYTVQDRTSNTGSDIWVLPMFGDRKPFLYLQTPFNEGAAHFSPDGKWIAYYSNESGKNEVYVAPFPGPGGKFQVSNSGGVNPRWRHDGKELYYMSMDRRVMAAEVKEEGAALTFGAVHPLFQTRAVSIFWGYDVTADGQRFLVNSLEQEESQPLTLVVNWPAALRR
jgi:Tol biopolymer transport system component/predicted Ser/Thr protein kinase